MKSPNPSNIDQWLFHYFEGDLSPADETLLEGFLLDHPEFDAQFEAWGAARMNPVNLEYVNQAALLKPWVTPTVLNYVTVFTAISINAVLAAFIIFNNTSSVSEWAMQANQLSAFEFAHGNASPLGSSELNYSNHDSFEPSYASMDLGNNSGNVAFSNPVYLGDTNANLTQNSNFNASMSQNVNGAIDSEQTVTAYYNQENSAETEHQQAFTEIAVNPSRTSIETNVELASNTRTSNQNDDKSSIDDKPHTNDGADASNANNGNSGNNRNTDSEDRERKLLNRSNRFKGGDLLLTNSRDVEYLVPGMTRNQLNFGHVASDFSNTLYSNTYLQWPGQAGALMTNQLGYDFYLPEAKSGVGLQMIYDRYANGTINNFEFSATYSPKFFLTKNVVLEPAVRFRMGGTSVDRSQFAPGTWVEFDRSNTFMYTYTQQNAQVNRSIHQDLGLGFLLNTKWGFVGANADNLMGAKNHALHYGSSNYDNRNPIFFNAVIGTEYESVNKKLRWSGQMVYQNYGNLNKFWFGSRIKYNYLSLGASVSSAGEPMLSFGLMARNFSMLYSTDYSLSQLSARKHLSHQLTMRVTLKESRMRKLLLN